MFKHLGEKIVGFGKRVGQKIKAGSKWVGTKIYDNRKTLLGIATAAAVGYGGHQVSQREDVKDAMEQVHRIREGMATIPSDAVGEREGYREQFKDIIKAPITTAGEKAVKAIKRGAKATSEALAEAGTKALFHGVPKRHSAELQILERGGYDAFGRPISTRPSNGNGHLGGW